MMCVECLADANVHLCLEVMINARGADFAWELNSKFCSTGRRCWSVCFATLARDYLRPDAVIAADYSRLCTS